MSDSRPNVRCPKCSSSDVHCHRDEGYWCRSCDLQEEFPEGVWRGAAYEAFRVRWNDPQPIVTDEEMQRGFEELQRSYAQSDREWFWPVEVEAFMTTREERVERLAREADDVHTKCIYDQHGKCIETIRSKQLPINQEIYAQILAHPDDDGPRHAYAQWLRTLDHPLAIQVAEFIEGQLWIDNQLRRDPRQNISKLAAPLPEQAFYFRTIEDWWAAMEPRNADVYPHPTRALEAPRLIDRAYRMRGFVEHVAIRAVRFPELADELFSLAPIRHLTLTYCKGHEHQDRELWKAVLASPYLRQIRSLRIWEHESFCPAPTVMNKLDDEDLELLAASPNAAGLVYLEMRNQTQVTMRGLEALATSPYLRGLSFVAHDYFSRSYPVMTEEWGGLGKLQSHLSERALHRYKDALEAKYGRIPWLHPVENYGSEAPRLEAVVAHPVALLGR